MKSSHNQQLHACVYDDANCHLTGDEARGMQNTVSDQQDAASDYGSEFTPDEEEILNGLLQAPPAPESSDNPITDSELLLQDIEGNEGPRGIRLPVFLQHALSSSMRVPEVADKRLQVQFDHSTEGSTNGKSPANRNNKD